MTAASIPLKPEAIKIFYYRPIYGQNRTPAETVEIRYFAAGVNSLFC